jgi:hypothetical protein
MCTNSDNSKSSSHEKNNDNTDYDQQTEFSLEETAQKSGSTIHQKLEEAGSTIKNKFSEITGAVGTKAGEVKHSFENKTEQLKDEAAHKSEEVHGFATDKVRGLKDTIDPTHNNYKQEKKTFGDKIGETGSAVVQKVMSMASNIHPHPEEKKEEDKHEKEEHKPTMKETFEHQLKETKKELENRCENIKLAAEEKTNAVRSRTAEELGRIESSIEPESKADEKPKSIGDHLKVAGSTVMSKAGAIRDGIQHALKDIHGRDDPHNDPSSHRQTDSNDLAETKQSK